MLIDAQRFGRIEAINARLRARELRQWDYIYTDALLSQQLGFWQGILKILLTIAQQDDAPLAVVGQNGSRETQTRRQVGIVGIGSRLELREIRRRADRLLDQRVSSDGDDAH